MTNSKPVSITLMVTAADPGTVQRTIEHFARAASGLALDGVKAALMVGPEEEEDDGDF